MKHFLGIDIGGSWIKGALVAGEQFGELGRADPGGWKIERVKSPLHASADVQELTGALKQLIGKFDPGPAIIGGIGISTAGIVDYHGTRVLRAATHLDALKAPSWKDQLEKDLRCRIFLVNDADAAAIGLAEAGWLTGNRCTGIMPVGTGLGFSVWKNGRRWRPGKVLNLLGSIRTPSGFFDSIAGSAGLKASLPGGNLSALFSKAGDREMREGYIRKLVDVINTAAILYALDEVILCGGLADAVTQAGYPLQEELNRALSGPPVELEHPVVARVAPEGNRLTLAGAVTLAYGEEKALSMRVPTAYDSIPTEIPYRHDLQLQELSTAELIETFWGAEQEAGESLKESIPAIARATERVSEQVSNGGRIIYVGSGTSGRVAAMDAVEIPCTYGFPEERILCLIAGGVADASIEIESDFEEDASSVPEMLLLNVGPGDAVIGISASGSAYYVQSALAFARSRGAYTVMIQSEQPASTPGFCQDLIPLNAGYEVVAGSTRMKSGTATKKILNMISSTVMIRMGKVAGPYMIDVACINNKLIDRAKEILHILYGMEREEAGRRLERAGMHLQAVIREIQSGRDSCS